MPLPEWLSWRRPERKEEDRTNQNAADPQQDGVESALPSDLRPARSWNSNLNKIDWSHYTTPQSITFSVITTLTTLVLVRLYKIHLRRIPTVEHLKPAALRKRSIYGYVTSVGDGDNFRLFHTPGGRLMGWGWFGRRRIQKWGAKSFKDNTMSVRIAGVDAPEAAHFGRPAQPYSQEALDWLRSFILHKYVRVWPYRQDQYHRVVSTVHRRNWLFKSDVGLEMLRRGLATVYEAKFGSEFGDQKQVYYAAESRAKERKIGMWAEPGLLGKLLGRQKSTETPREYKTRIAQQEMTAQKSDLAK